MQKCGIPNFVIDPLWTRGRPSTPRLEIKNYQELKVLEHDLCICNLNIPRPLILGSPSLLPHPQVATDRKVTQDNVLRIKL